MAKIVLKHGDKTFTIITHETSMFWLPCLGEDGQLYCISDRIYSWDNTPRNDMDFLDEKQRLCIKNQDKVMFHTENVEYNLIPNWDKEIFNKVNGMKEYIKEWEAKHKKKW